MGWGGHSAWCESWDGLGSTLWSGVANGSHEAWDILGVQDQLGRTAGTEGHGPKSCSGQTGQGRREEGRRSTYQYYVLGPDVSRVEEPAVVHCRDGPCSAGWVTVVETRQHWLPPLSTPRRGPCHRI